MSWGSEEEKVCLDCGHEYLYECDTLNIASGNRGQCPTCGSDNTKRKEWSDEKMAKIFGENWREHVNADLNQTINEMKTLNWVFKDLILL